MSTAQPVHPTAAARVTLRPLGPGDARIGPHDPSTTDPSTTTTTPTTGFWALRQDRNGRRAIRDGYARLEAAGNFRNLRLAAEQHTAEQHAAEQNAPTPDKSTGPIFMDSDVYKWLEAVAWECGRDPADDLRAMQHEVTALVARAQQADGYIDSVQQLRFGTRYDDLRWSHELYCAGHLMQAAVAQSRATGETGLLDVAVRLGDHLVRTFGPGEDHVQDIDGHPVVEMGLVELFRETGTTAYLDLARWFVDARGHGIIERTGAEPTYFSDRVPVRDATTVEGHAVRAVYLAAGAVDVATETGDVSLLAASERQFRAMLASKAYITGGLGSRWDMEAFGDPYELPTDRGYSETCAAIGGMQWAWRLLLATGDPTYADAMERLLYDAFLPGVSLSGTEYFYVNPLQLREDAHQDENRSPAHGRRGWFDCACCPPNIMRTFASMDGYVATQDGEGIQIHQYVTGDYEGSGAAVHVETGYPFDGRVTVEARRAGDWTLTLRVPAWSDDTHVALVERDGSSPGRAGAAPDTDPPVRHVSGPLPEPVAGRPLRITRTWAEGDVVTLDLDMTVRLYEADSRIDASRGQVAVERGPLVYAVEQADQNGVRVDDLLVDADAPILEHHRADLLDGVVTLELAGVASERPPSEWPYRRIRPAGPRERPPGAGGGAGGTPALPGDRVIAIPYYAWANRGAAPMRVWLPRA